MAKLVGNEQLSIVTDHLGTPVLMVDGDGRARWSATTGIYGELRNLDGERHACPFRWPGQYEDAETGLYYNRHRYYDPESGEYTSQDPIGLDGGLTLYGYVADPLAWTDPLGLAKCHGNSKQSANANHVYVIRDKQTGEVHKWGISGGKIRKDGKSYRAESQVRKLNRSAGSDVYESSVIKKNLTRERALDLEQGKVNAYSVARQRVIGTPPGGPVGNELPKATM
jgi:RHS repeat-associated protein